MKIPMSSVQYMSDFVPTYQSTNPSRKVQSFGMTFESGNIRGSTSFGIRLEGTVIVVITKTSALIPSTSNATAVWTSLTSKLTKSVTSGSYTAALRTASTAYGATAVDGAVATSVTSSQPVEDVPSSGSSDDDTLSAGAISGIAIGGFAFLILICGVGYYFFINYRPPIPQSSEQKETASKTENPALPKTNSKSNTPSASPSAASAARARAKAARKKEDFEIGIEL